MSFADTLQKVKIQVQACMRGIHGDYVLVERADLKALLDDHDRLTKLMWSSVQRSLDEWKKTLSGEELLKQYNLAIEALIPEMPADMTKAEQLSALRAECALSNRDPTIYVDEVQLTNELKKYGAELYEKEQAMKEAGLAQLEGGKICDTTPKTLVKCTERALEPLAQCGHVYVYKGEELDHCYYCGEGRPAGYRPGKKEPLCSHAFRFNGVDLDHCCACGVKKDESNK